MGLGVGLSVTGAGGVNGGRSPAGPSYSSDMI